MELIEQLSGYVCNAGVVASVYPWKGNETEEFEE